ncbi:hypothetical protein D1641_01255 [Colidextribacter sp. OB.20]|uniref:hypothetical protein n=1 Tax=Colidextribacter sp. OB.20 TaxID=2304568 RepID=UPI00136FD33D|nr:hypothetical protein [Colidextribacter sp. OB.20]NBI08647.1 hypothetical protein [Colidextribacter sp. OB.20]
MAKLSVSGIDDLMLSLEEIASIPDDVAAAMLDAEAQVVEEYQLGSAATMLKGPYSTGQTALSIRRGKMKKGRDGARMVYVSPTGTNDRGVRNAEVAFINEYGIPKSKGRQARPGRQFIRIANEKAADPAVAEAEKIYDEFLKSKNL